MRYAVVAYDVVKDRRRDRLARRLLVVLRRVQKSVFEGPLDASGLDAVRRAIREEIDHGTDTVRLAPLCAACRDRVEVYGTAEVISTEPEDVVLEGGEW